MRGSCNNDCLHCIYKDCVNDTYDPAALSMVLAFEAAFGICFPSEEEALYAEIVEAFSVERENKERRKKAAERRRQKRKEMKENAC